MPIVVAPGEPPVITPTVPQAGQSGLFPAGGGFTVDEVHSDTWGMFYRSWAIGIMPSLRINLVSIPGRVGKRSAGTEIDSRVVHLSLTAVQQSRPVMMANMRAFTAAIDPRVGPHRLCLLDDDPDWFINVIPNTEISAAPALITADFDATFEAADPHWYYRNPRIYRWDAVSGSSLLGVDNTHGNTPTPPVITVVPAVQMPGFTLVYGGSSFTFTGFLNAGDVVVVDVDEFAVTVNGVNRINAWSGDFPLLPVGAGQTVTWAANGGAHVTFTYTERSI